MKRLLGALLLTFVLILSSCKKDDKESYIDSSILINDLLNYVDDVFYNEEIVEYIKINYKNNKIKEKDYEGTFESIKNELFEFTKTNILNTYNLDDDYFANIKDIKLLYPYMMIKENDMIDINFNYNIEYIKEGVIIPNFKKELKYIITPNFEIVSNDNEVIFNEELVNNEFNFVYLVFKDKVFKLIFNLVEEDIPFVFNPNVYSDFREDILFKTYLMGGTISIPDENIDSKYVRVVNDSIFIDKDYLNSLDLINEIFRFSIVIKLNNIYYSQIINVKKSS